MLEQLLNEIKKGGILQPGILAARLNLSISMVEAMLSNLESLGFLQQVEIPCTKPCTGCPLEDGCISQDHKNRLWVLKQPPAGAGTAVIKTG